MTNVIINRKVLFIMNFFDKLFGKQTNSAEANTNALPQSPALKKKVLIVEDEALLSDAMEAKCKLAGLDVLKAFNGQQGLEMAIANKPNIILLDLLMPVMDGKTMLHRLRGIPEFKKLPVIILTNSGEVDNFRETTLYDNANAFFIKSNVNPDDIVRKINELLPS